MRKLLFLIFIIFIQCKNEESIKNVDSTISVEQNVNNEKTAETVAAYSFKVVKIDSLLFKKDQFKFQIKKAKIKRITNVDSIIQLTKNRAVIKYDIVGEDENNRLYYLDKIILESGEIIYCNQNRECGLVAYYPDENIILSECGHSSDDCYNLLNGKTTTQVGNPAYILESPSKKFRLNGYFPGQECSTYFMQKKIKGEYLKIFEINEVYPYKNVPKNLCTMENLFWSDDYTLNFTIKNYEVKGTGINEYYQLKIKE